MTLTTFFFFNIFFMWRLLSPGKFNTNEVFHFHANPLNLKIDGSSTNHPNLTENNCLHLKQNMKVYLQSEKMPLVLHNKYIIIRYHHVINCTSLQRLLKKSKEKKKS